MINRLKRRFIFINFSLLCGIVFAILGGTYYLMSKSTEVQSNQLLQTIAQSDGSFFNFRPQFYQGKNHAEEVIEFPYQEAMKRNAFAVMLDKNYNIIQIISTTSESDEFENAFNLISDIIRNPMSLGIGEYEGLDYRYLKESRAYGTILVVLDRSLEIVTTNQLVLVLCLIGGMSLVVLFLLSIFLAKWAINPIELSWNKQKQFVADASHELKTPLAVIKTTTDVILGNPTEIVSTQEKWLNYIKAETARLSELVNHLLYLARVDNDEVYNSFTTVNLSETIYNTCLPLEAIMFEDGIEFELDIVDNVFLSSDESAIQQLLIILLDNAIKHCACERIIKVTLKSEYKSIVLSVSNTGIGIEPQYHEKIFERFYRVDDSRQRETGGYGLGLSIAKTIVMLHKGKIEVQSEYNAVTTFTVTFTNK